MPAVFNRRTALLRMAAQGAVRPVALVLAGLYAAFAVAHVVVLPTPAARIMAPVALVSTLCYLLLGWRARDDRVARNAPRALLAMAGIALINSLLHQFLFLDPVLTTNLLLVILGSGVFLVGARCLAWVIIPALVAWTGMGWMAGFQEPLWIHFGVGLVSATVLSILIFQARNRFFLRIARLEVEAQQQEMAIAASEARFRHLFEASPAMICVHDLEGVISDVNEVGAAALGFSREALIGRRIEEFLVNAGTGAHLDYLATLVEKGTATGLATVHTADGGVRRWRYENTLFSDPLHGRYVVGTALDVTELEAARAEIEATKVDLEYLVAARTEELVAANARMERELAMRTQMEAQLREQHTLESLGRLAGGVAHEFNNLLAIVRGATEHLVPKVSDPEATRALEEIDAAIDRGGGVVSQILMFSHLDVRSHAPFAIEPVLRDTVELLRGSLRAGIRLELHVASEIGNVLGSPTQIRQVLINLVANASQALDAEGGRVRITAMAGGPRVLESGGEARPCVDIEVLDSGPGIPQNLRAKVFDPFFTTRKAGEARGLGLSVAHGIIRGHGGSIRIECPSTGGTRVTVSLPQTGEAAEPRRAGAHTSRGTEGFVLVVDDEPAIRRAAVEQLERAGYRVESAADGPAALEVLARGGAPCGVLVTDYSMPSMQGDDLIQRARKRIPGLPALVITGFGMTLDLAALQRDGPTRILVKPFRAKDLAAEVAELIATPVDGES